MSSHDNLQITDCIVYCRVSSDKQVKEGHGLDSQELRCREYATSKNYQVVKVFKEEGVSGGLFERPAMNKLLEFLSEAPRNKHYVVVFDDIKRLARDTEIHFALKRTITKLGHRVESPNFKFEDTPEGKFMETIFAATSALEKDQNARQVKQKMKARMALGYWCLRSPPLGLKYIEAKLQGTKLKVIVNDEPYWSIFKEAIESYDHGLLNTLEEVRQFIQKKYTEKEIERPVSISGVKAILTELLYTGYMAYPKWEIPFMKGKHKGFIDIETYNRVQKKLQGKAKFAARKDYNLDFPLRPVTLCDTCGKPLTGAWSKGRSNKYAYYWCKNNKCKVYGKSIKNKDIEGHFLTLLQVSKPSEEVAELTKDVLLNAWENKSSGYFKVQEQAHRKINELSKQLTDIGKQLARKLSEGDQEMVKIYEEQMRRIKKEQEELQGILGKPKYTREQFRTASEKVMGTLKDPIRMWKSDEYRDKLTIFGMYFDDKLRYDKNEGFRTATLALPVGLMKEAEGSKTNLVEMAGVEPASEETLLKNV